MKSYRIDLYLYSLEKNYIQQEEINHFYGLPLLSGNLYDSVSFRRMAYKSQTKNSDLENKLLKGQNE